MKKFIAITIMTLFALLLCFGVTFAEEKKKSSWYIGFGIGTGQLKIEGETMDDFYEDYSYIDVGNELTLHFSVGAILNPKLHLGFDGSLIRQTADSDYDATLDVQVNNYFAALSFYPVEKGIYLKAGIGLSTLVAEIDTPFYDDSETYSGTGFLLGIGYDFWLGKSFNLGIHAEYSKQNYSDSDAPDNTEFTSIYLSFSWF